MLSTRDRDDGFTLVEMSIAMLLAGIIAVSLFATLGSGTNAERDLQQVADTQERVRVALVELTSDIRETTAIGPASDASSIAVTHLSLNGASTSAVVWTYDAAAQQLTRTTDIGDGNGPQTTFRLTGAAPDPAYPVFTYFKSDGVTTLAPADAPACAASVAVHLRGVSDPGGHPSSVDTKVDLRNVHPGGGC
ncbi:MAG TPA: type II secretion system protein [Acidimicrobiales bacterium]|nr:type II secretion system protein [Acidimicrobiales bacterium]